jgi:7-cyano-7-deazaguanine synthase
VILLSGGIDSALILAMQVSAGASIHCLCARYGQRHSYEAIAGKKLAERFPDAVESFRTIELDLSVMGKHPLLGLGEMPSRTLEEIRNTPSPAYVPARNTILLSLGLGLCEVVGADRLMLGSNRDDWAFPDCRPEFIIAWRGLGRVATLDKVVIEAPLLTWPKSQVIQALVGFYSDVIPLQDTLSCYQPPRARYSGDQGFLHCGRCDACVLRRDAAQEAAKNLPGWTDPTTYAADL